MLQWMIQRTLQQRLGTRIFRCRHVVYWGIFKLDTVCSALAGIVTEVASQSFLPMCSASRICKALLSCMKLLSSCPFGWQASCKLCTALTGCRCWKWLRQQSDCSCWPQGWMLSLQAWVKEIYVPVESCKGHMCDIFFQCYSRQLTVCSTATSWMMLAHCSCLPVNWAYWCK